LKDQSNNEMHGLYIVILHVNLLLSCGSIIYISVADLQLQIEAADRTGVSISLIWDKYNKVELTSRSETGLFQS